MLSDRLAKKVAIITGAAGGIGFAAARRFCTEGATVALLDSRADEVERAASDLQTSGWPAVPAVADVSAEADVRRVVEELYERFGRLDIVFNNAGVARMGTIGQITTTDWDRSFDVNVKGVFVVSRVALPYLQATGGAVIVNQASVAGMVGIPNMAAYCASKGAVIALTRAMAVDFGPLGIRVNAIAPGTVVTPMTEGLLAARGGGDRDTGIEKTAEKYPLGRLGTAEEIASAAVFLCSDEASFITGAVLAADGGMTCQ